MQITYELYFKFLDLFVNFVDLFAIVVLVGLCVDHD